MRVVPAPAVQRVEVGEALAGERLDRAVALLCDVTRAAATGLVAAGAVSVDGSVETARARRVQPGEVLEVSGAANAAAEQLPGLVGDADVHVRVLWDDEHVIVVDKPPGLVVHPGAGHERVTLVHGLLALYPEIAAVGDPARPGIVHRLDSGTSGLMAVARTTVAYDSLVAQLSARTVDRRYLALVWGHVESPSGLVDAPIGRSSRDRLRMAVSSTGRPARTRYEVVARFSDPATVTLLECSLETGRTHQVRVHLDAIGHTIVGDRRYGGARSALVLDRPFLHATSLELDHPVTGERRRHTSPLPADLATVRAGLH